MSTPAGEPPENRGVFWTSQDFGAGVFLLALAGIALVGSLSLHFAQGTGVGPGMMPRSIAALIAVFGVLFIIQSMLSAGSALERWSIRGAFFVLGSALVFAWTIRPLGVIVAGPLCVLIASMADKDTKLIEVVPFAIIITLGCIGLFSYGLRLPMPVMPTSMPYPLDQWL